MRALAIAPRERRETGMLFSGRMVRAIRAGSKWQTRRVAQVPRGYELDGYRNGEPPALLCSRPNRPTGERAVERYAAGDRLWVRETYALIWPGECAPEHERDNIVEYRADYTDDRPPGQWPYECRSDPDCPRWQSPMFMPRWAARLELELEAVRIHRLQDIDPHSIRAEGVQCPEHDVPGGFCVGECDALRRAFVELWDGLGRRKSPPSAATSGLRYADDPLVWALTFHVVPTVQASR